MPESFIFVVDGMDFLAKHLCIHVKPTLKRRCINRLHGLSLCIKLVVWRLNKCLPSNGRVCSSQADFCGVGV